MHFKFTGGEPIYIQIASQLEEAIFTGVFFRRRADTIDYGNFTRLSY